MPLRFDIKRKEYSISEQVAQLSDHSLGTAFVFEILYCLYEVLLQSLIQH